MKKKYKILLFIVILLLAVIFYFYKFVLYKEARNISQEEPVFSVTSKQLSQDYKNNISDANAKYLNKTIEVEGIINEVGDSILTLNEGIFCSFLQATKDKKVSSHVKVKGRLIGYDDLLEEIKLDQCTSK